MDIKWTAYDCIKLDNGIAISVNSETPGSTSAHSKVVDAIIEAVGKIEGSGKPTCDAVADAGQVPCSEVTEADPKLGEPAGNPPAPLGESKPKLMISIAKTMGQGTTKRGLKVISIIFENLYEVFDRDEERAMAFVKCIGSTAFKGAEAASMDNGREVVVSESYYLGVDSYGELIKRAKQSIQWAATLAAIDCEITVC